MKRRPEFIDLAGKKFNRWNAVEYIGQNQWKCFCDCSPDKYHVVRGYALTGGKSKSCGCIRREGDCGDLTGKRFGKLIVIKRVENDSRRYSQWLCNCDCKKKDIIIKGSYLRCGYTTSCGCDKPYIPRRKIKDLTGKKFGRWTVIRRAENFKHNTRWECICDCKKDCNDTSIVCSSSLVNGSSKSCGCFGREKSSLPYGQASFNRMIRTYRRHAKDRNISFDLSEDDIRNLTQQNCYYCNAEPNQTIKSKDCNGDYIYNGIDRLDSSLGYTIQNSVPCCGKCNAMKMAMSFSDFKSQILTIVKNMNW